MHNGYWNDGWNSSGSWIVMAAMMVIFWGGLVWLGITLLRRPAHIAVPAVPTPNAAPAPTQRTPESILAERLAKGEIDPDDYHQRLQVLQARPDDR